MSHSTRIVRVAAAFLGVGLTATMLAGQSWDLARQVEIRRTLYGVPHIVASDLRGVAFGLAYAETEDHGERVFMALARARGQLARAEGTAENIQSDLGARQSYAVAVATYSRLDDGTRAMMEGFAEGVNHYLALHADEAPAGVEPNFTGVDAHALYIGGINGGLVRRFLARLEREGGGEEAAQTESVQSEVLPPEAAFGYPDTRDPDVGSNAWALGPRRTVSGSAILVRNPHLSWSAGYYEAHLSVPGVLDFYGDFRVGSLFGIIGGFNLNLGWTTTNNAPDLDEIYELEMDPDRPDHYLFGGESLALEPTESVVEARADAPNGQPSYRLVRRGGWRTVLGPVIHRTSSRAYVIKSADEGEYRRGEQFLRMMRASTLDEWLDAMRHRAISSSNYTYADREGNILYVWNAKVPHIPYAPVEADEAVRARGPADVWQELEPFDRLPRLLNPPGGYLRNENDPPYFTNLNVPMNRDSFPANFPEAGLRLRSQLSLELLHNNRRFSLEDVIRLKHSPRMLLADRVKDELIALARVSDVPPEVREAARVLDRWDNTASIFSRGGVLFQLWWERYNELTDSTRVYNEPWSSERPTTTPRGLGSENTALSALGYAARTAVERWGAMDVPWGDVHRVRRGSVDVPVAGCSGALGCFRVLQFEDAEDGARVANGGDGWVLAVEFGDVPRAYSVLAYGESSREDSAHFDDQAAMFARGEFKEVAFTEAQIAQQLLRAYRPGEEIEARQ